MYYTESIELEPHETTHSNRALCFIQKLEFKRAEEDCKAAIRINPEFARTYKRLFRAHLGQGNV